MIKLRELITEKNIHNNIEYWYHGRTVDSTIFSYDYVGGENAYDQEGVGFYFTSDLNDAKHYAEYKGIVLKCKLNYKKLIYKTSSENTKCNKKIIIDLIKNSPTLDSTLENFDENPKRAFIHAVNLYMNYGDAWDSYQTIANDFYKYNAQEYLLQISKYYDGQWTEKRGFERQDDIIHLIVYNPSIIHVIEKIIL